MLSYVSQIVYRECVSQVLFHSHVSIMCLFGGNEIYEEMKDVLLDAKAAAEKLAKDVLKLTSKVDKSDLKSSTEM